MSPNFLPETHITISADADDSDGEIVKVEFYEGGNNKLGEVNALPYSIE